MSSLGHSLILTTCKQTHLIVGSAFGALAEGDDVSKPNMPAAPAAPAAPTWKERMMKGVEYDMHAAVEDDPLVAAIHANAEKWDEDTEFVFGYLQVISAICVIFAHGAGEVGYMAGPLAVIYDVIKSPGKNVVASGGTVMPEIWQILIGAFGLLVGLATYGYKVCAAVGTQMAKITPSRGYAAELATSFVIMIAAQFSLPTSSSQCITGGILGIALFEGAKGINYRLVGMTAMSWVWTLLVMGLGTALIFAQGLYAPNKFITIGYSDRMRSFQTLCAEHNYCRRGEYLSGCGLTVSSATGRPEYRGGTCANCSTFAAANCRPWQFLSGCNTARSGSCTNCTSSNKAWTAEKPFVRCATGEYLTGCPGTCTSAK
jgi:hypothetical protein